MFRSLDALAVPALVSLKLDKISLPDIDDELSALAVASITELIQYEYYGGKYHFLKSLRNARVLELRSFTTTVCQSIRPVIKPLGFYFFWVQYGSESECYSGIVRG
jgi:hypothetical protein